MCLTNFRGFMSFKATNALIFRLWERAFQKQSDQHTREWTLPLIESQLEATSIILPGSLQRELVTALTRMSIQANKRDAPLQIYFMDLIEALFVNLNQGVPKLRKNDKQ